MDQFAVQFAEAHWDKADVPKTGGGTKTDVFVQELRDAAAEGKPAILIVYSREEDGKQNAADWRLLVTFFGAAGPVSESAAGFVKLGMNRKCGCWKVSPWKLTSAMIVLFDHRGEAVKKITSAQYKASALAADLAALQAAADRARGQATDR